MTEYYGIHIQRKQWGCIDVQSTGGPLFSNSVAGQLVTCSNTNLWLQPDVSKPEKRLLARQVGLKPDEINLLSALPRQICEQASHNKDLNELVNDEGQETEYLLDLNGSTPLHKLLTMKILNCWKIFWLNYRNMTGKSGEMYKYSNCIQTF